MNNTLEFNFENEGRLRLELLEEGELLIHLQAKHPGEGWKITSTNVIIDREKVEAIKAWFLKLEENPK